jgi:hypothetical protein
MLCNAHRFYAAVNQTNSTMMTKRLRAGGLSERHKT